MADEQPRYEAAVRIVLEHQEASVALVQRHLRLGYAEACGLFECMQAEGIVMSVVAAGRVWALREGYRLAGHTDPGDPA
jgi:DNA segregation ATPase FtsK/SpoIIIE-like protein